jgi:hypothetical protein
VEGGTPTGDLTASITARMFTGAAPSVDASTTGAGATTATTTATTTAPTGSSNTGTDQ